jgi:hypothetical protein
VDSKPRDNEKYTQESLGAHEHADKSLVDLRAWFSIRVVSLLYQY